MEFRKILSLLFLTFFAGTMAVSAQMSAQDIENMLKERDQQIKELVGPEGTEYTDEQKNEIQELINGVIDFEAMSKVALEDTYTEISDEERTEFVSLFTTVVKDQSLNKLEIYRASVSYESIEVEESSALVNTIAELKDVRTPVIYRMEYKNNEWLITDMSVDDVWTAESYNRQFQRIIRRNGFEALLESLRKRAARAE